MKKNEHIEQPITEDSEGRELFGDLNSLHHLRRHMPVHNRRVVLLVGSVFGILMVLAVGALITLIIQVMNFPRHPHMMMSERRIEEFIPLLIFFLILGAFLFVGRWSRRRISVPLEKILNAADRISEGDLTTRIEGIGYGPFLRVETAFNNMVEALEHSDKLRRDQTADISHELNTPIHIIRGYLEGIHDGIYEPDEEMINLLMEETALLSRLVEDLRLLTLADAGQLTTHPEVVNLKNVFEDIEVSFQGHANEAGIEFNVQSEEHLLIEADPSHIYRIINNLVSNALSYTEAGGVVQLSLQKDTGTAMLTIADTGQGMSEEDAAHAFDRFWRKDKSRQRKDGGGYGLGLAIVQQLVLVNGGKIKLESKLGKGTMVRLVFPSLIK